jgi:hypothetical protein
VTRVNEQLRAWSYEAEKKNKQRLERQRYERQRRQDAKHIIQKQVKDKYGLLFDLDSIKMLKNN